MKVRFHGGSDDIISYDVDDGKIRDEIYLGVVAEGSQGVGYSLGVLSVTSIGGAYGCKVYVVYDGCWSFVPGFLGEGKKLPENWSFAISNEHEYSASLTIWTNEPVVIGPWKDKDNVE